MPDPSRGGVAASNLATAGGNVATLDGLEALAAATIDPAVVLGLSDAHGTLAPGRRANLVILDGDAFRQVPYRPGHNLVRHTYIGGRKVGGR